MPKLNPGIPRIVTNGKSHHTSIYGPDGKKIPNVVRMAIEMDAHGSRAKALVWIRDFEKQEEFMLEFPVVEITCPGHVS